MFVAGDSGVRSCPGSATAVLASPIAHVSSFSERDSVSLSYGVLSLLSSMTRAVRGSAWPLAINRSASCSGSSTLSSS